MVMALLLVARTQALLNVLWPRSSYGLHGVAHGERRRLRFDVSDRSLQRGIIKCTSNTSTTTTTTRTSIGKQRSDQTSQTS